MHIQKILCVAAICTGLQAAVAGTAHARTQAPAAAPVAAVACPSQDFRTFLKAFRNSEQIQRAYTVIPLPFTSLDEDFKDKKTLLQASEIDFPLIGNDAKLKKFGVKTSITPQKNGMRVMDSSGMSEVTVYRFAKKDRCWRLVGMENPSP